MSTDLSRSALERSASWILETHFRWAKHADSAEAFWRDATAQVRGVVQGYQAEIAELEVTVERLTADGN